MMKKVIFRFIMMTKFKSIHELYKIFPNEKSCIKYLERHRWKGIISSPFNPNSKVYPCANNQYKCEKTNRYFNVKVGTIFENTKIPLQQWFWVLYSFVNRKKSISSCQLAEDIHVTQKTAWFMLQKLRHASNLALFKEMLKDFVEVDEAFVGGSNLNRHWDKKVPNSQGRSWKDKTPVLGIVERESGKVFIQVVPNVKQNTLKSIIKNKVKKGSTIYTDEWYRHSRLDKYFTHELVNHKIKQYVNGKASTNAVENRWSHLKRIITGIHHWVSKKHLQKYIDEFVMKNNTRKYNKQDKFDLLLSSTIGKRLTYQQLTN